MSQVVLTCPVPPVELRVTLRIIAVAMVMSPTAKTRPILIFSTREILRFQRTRRGTAMT